MNELKSISTDELKSIEGGNPAAAWAVGVLIGAAISLNWRDDYDLGHVFRSVKTS